ncbi:MAG: heterodisulfide reductase-related iron-sulfur binding cluster [Oscillospiraceae bacterium]|nr:heterodisulfide reductase-related iron-sulfur binding cluster [Oscillospiraceae bacterium]
MRQSDTMAIVESCFHGQPASCTHNCPFGLDIRALMDKAANGKWSAAYKAFRNAVIFPAIASRLCPAPCKSNCQRADIGDEPIDLPLIEQAIIEYAKKKTAEKYVIPPKEQSAAIIGAGASGLACALALAQKKYQVTVYEKSEGWGGELREHRDFGIFDEDIGLQLSAVNIAWQFGHEVKSIDELAGFDVVYLATGKSGDDFGLLSSHDQTLYTTASAKIFLGGGLSGAALMDAIAMGTAAAGRIEAFLQTGKADAAVTERRDCSRHVEHEGVENAPRIKPESGGSYTEDEARQEAVRCMQCDCAACMASCDMMDSFRKKPKKIATEVYADTQASSTFSTRSLTRETYSCNMCSHCKSVCPEGINIGELFAMSRRNRVETGVAPFALHDYWLREMDFHTNVAAFAAAPNEKCEYIFYPGCQLGAYNPAHVLKTYEHLKSRLDCGIYVGCCGAPAFWAGDYERLNANVDYIRKSAEALGNPVFIFACATCETMFSEYLPELKRTSLYELLADSGGLKPGSALTDAAVFDPCSARGDDGMMGAVRRLASAAGVRLEELPERNRCCGYGGLVQGGNPGMFKKVADSRAKMSDKLYIAYCANCREVLLSSGKDCVHILDIALGLPQSMEVPAISERRRNSSFVKTELMRELEDEVFKIKPQPWDGLALVIEKGLAEDIDRKLISEDDMKEVIWNAESSGEKFFDEADESFVACLSRRVLTYWVKYRVLPDGVFEVCGAYYHRMSFSGAGE